MIELAIAVFNHVYAPYLRVRPARFTACPDRIALLEMRIALADSGFGTASRRLA
jgi:hypothetical protein